MKAAEVPLLEVRGLSISFEAEDGEDKPVLRNASLRIGRGEIVGLMGASGGGKTTLALALLGLLRSSPGVLEGLVLLDGKPLAGKGVTGNPLRRARGRDISAVFQEPRAALDPYFSVGQHLLESLRRSAASGKHETGATDAELRALGLGFLEDAGLENAARLWGTFPHQLSGGMAQRVMIAMALCARPKLLVADEPSTALDATTQAKLLKLFRRLRDKHGLSILLISHDPGVIRETCDRAYALEGGGLVETPLPVIPASPNRPISFPVYTEASPPLLEVRDLRKTFRRDGKSFPALDGVSLKLRQGETYALVGESGSGKSTLALSILALQEVNGGSVLYNGENLLDADAARMRNLRREIRMLFQHPEAVLNGGMTVSAILAEGLEKDGEFARSEIRPRVAEILEKVHLHAEYGRRYPRNLSSGEKQRVAIARSLITRPKLLVCDEPVASLDFTVQTKILELLGELQLEMGLTYLFISHNLDRVKELAHRIGVMYQGKIVEELAAEDFTLEKAAHPYTRLLLESSRAD